MSYETYHKCGKPDCHRLVKQPSIFCCSPCALASEGGYEIHEHSPGCDKRALERGAQQ